MSIVDDMGQRAYVGKVNMDQNSPDHYREDTGQSLQDTKTFILNTQAKQVHLDPPRWPAKEGPAFFVGQKGAEPFGVYKGGRKN